MHKNDKLAIPNEILLTKDLLDLLEMCSDP